MRQDIIEHWDEEHGVARCILSYRMSSGAYLKGIGIAECHPDDTPFISQLTGSVIAQYRAEIDLLKQINHYEIAPGITALKHVYCTMLHSSHYNPDSYEAKRLKRELAHLMDEQTENQNMITLLQKNLAQYIKQKEQLYKKIREGQK